MVCYQSVPSGLGSMRCRRGNRPHGKTADPNSVITVIKRNDNNNSNNNNDNNNNNNNNNDNNINNNDSNNNNNNNNNSNNTTNDDNSNNTFKMICPQSLVHNERMLAIFKYKTQQTF